ncbi:MAG TPA: Wadjet anti-phage system protein JetD domain-containing protein [Myxococcota bacterium]|nr:Wadjet anti-phage system protein JetD domain-containing protein [Myxococcota bacterium]
MWRGVDERMALLELLVRGALKRRRSQAAAYDALAELPWTRATGRRDEIGLVEERRPELVALIGRVWPTWGATLAELTASGLPPTPDGWVRLEDRRRAAALPALPLQLNRHTAIALVAAHSKATLTEPRRAALGDSEVTHDGSVRLRPPDVLRARTRRGAIDLAAIAGVLGEVSIPERAFLDGLVLEGAPRAVLLVENLGAWRDLPALAGWLFAHVPGWDTATAARLLELTRHVPVVHFGDLDPNGVRISASLREMRPDLRWFVPPFWSEYVELRGQRAPWPPELDLREAPPLVRELAARGIWLEQEPIVLDPRIAPALESMVSLPR